MTTSGRRYRTMLHSSTTFLIVALVIAINVGDGATATEADSRTDQVAEESRPPRPAAVLAPTYVNQTSPPPTTAPATPPPPKPPHKDKPKLKYVEMPRQFYGHVVQVPNRPYPNNPVHYGPNPPKNLYKYPQVIPLNNRGPYYAAPSRQQLVFAASTGKPYIITKSPKFSIPVQTVNGIRADNVRPPNIHPNPTKPSKPSKHKLAPTTTSTSTTTTQKPLRNKRIWPKHIRDKMNITSSDNTTETVIVASTAASKTDDLDQAGSVLRIRLSNRTATPPPAPPASTRGYQRVTRLPKHKPSTPAPLRLNMTIQPNDWIPIVPSHYPARRPKPNNVRRSDIFSNRRSDFIPDDAESRRVFYLHSFGLVPLRRSPPTVNEKKKMYFYRKRRQLNPRPHFGSRPKGARPSYSPELAAEESRPHKVVKIKHHHHHHHHRYIKTVEKKVPVKVEVPKPYPVPVEKKVPVPYPVEKKVPYPVQVPVKVIEKEYVPKPYPIIHHVPVYRQVEVRVPHPVRVEVEKRVPYPVEVPVDRPVPVPVHVEKKVPYAVPVKVYVPQPYPVEKRVPYPVEVKVKEPYEVIRHVAVEVPVPQPFPVKVPHPVRVEVEKRVPYPVEVEKRVPVPFKVYVPQRVEVEKRVPVYVPKPYPVEKKVPVPVKVPYPVKVPVPTPVQVPVGVPVYLHPSTGYDNDHYVYSGFTVSDESVTTESPTHTVTVHGNTGFQGFSSRSDNESSEGNHSDAKTDNSNDTDSTTTNPSSS